VCPGGFTGSGGTCIVWFLSESERERLGRGWMYEGGDTRYRGRVGRDAGHGFEMRQGEWRDVDSEIYDGLIGLGELESSNK